MLRKQMGVLVTLVTVLAACSTSTSEAPKAPSPAVSVASSPTSAQPTTAVGNSQAQAAGAAAASSLKFCSDWKQGSAKVSTFGAPGAGAPAAIGTPAADLKSSIEYTTAFMKGLADQSPSEVKPDFQVLANFWVGYSTVLARNNYDFSRAAADPDFSKTMASATDMQKATTNIQTWMTKNCAG